MGFLGFGKKKNIPDELPELISDEMEKESVSEVNNFLKEEENKKTEEAKIIETKEETKKEDERITKQTKENVLNRLIKNVNETPEREEVRQPILPRKSFFDEFQDKLDESNLDISSLEEWYNQKFLSRNILSDMKTYWEKQKKVDVLDFLSNDIQTKISEKVKILKDLEKGWQVTYFELIEKEEEIKDVEEELKGMIQEFMKICKHKKDSLEGNNYKKKNKNKIKENDGEKNESEEKEDQD
ncbi:hypothetical protein GW932_02330 [archaeon]|nr:hypothetical protein [archaeon]